MTPPLDYLDDRNCTLPHLPTPLELTLDKKSPDWLTRHGDHVAAGWSCHILWSSPTPCPPRHLLTSQNLVTNHTTMMSDDNVDDKWCQMCPNLPPSLNPHIHSDVHSSPLSLSPPFPHYTAMMRTQFLSEPPSIVHVPMTNGTLFWPLCCCTGYSSSKWRPEKWAVVVPSIMTSASDFTMSMAKQGTPSLQLQCSRRGVYLGLGFRCGWVSLLSPPFLSLCFDVFAVKMDELYWMDDTWLPGLVNNYWTPCRSPLDLGFGSPFYHPSGGGYRTLVCLIHSSWEPSIVT